MVYRTSVSFCVFSFRCSQHPQQPPSRSIHPWLPSYLPSDLPRPFLFLHLLLRAILDATFGFTGNIQFLPSLPSHRYCNKFCLYRPSAAIRAPQSTRQTSCDSMEDPFLSRRRNRHSTEHFSSFNTLELTWNVLQQTLDPLNNAFFKQNECEAGSQCESEVETCSDISIRHLPAPIVASLLLLLSQPESLSNSLFHRQPTHFT